MIHIRGKYMLVVLMALGLMSLQPRLALAERPLVELEMTAHKVIESTNSNGEVITKLVEPTTVIPGDIIVYTTHYRNISDKSVGDIAITNQIPAEMRLIDNSLTENVAVKFSIDGGKHFDVPSKLFKTSADNQQVPAASSDYTNLQWTFSTLAPQAKGSVSFRAQLQ